MGDDVGTTGSCLPLHHDSSLALLHTYTSKTVAVLQRGVPSHPPPVTCRLLPSSSSILLPSTTKGKLSGSCGCACAGRGRERDETEFGKPHELQDNRRKGQVQLCWTRLAHTALVSGTTCCVETLVPSLSTVPQKQVWQ